MKTSTGGVTGYFGYEYQFYTSVLLLLVSYKKTGFRHVKIETLFGQDAELDFERLAQDQIKTIGLSEEFLDSSTIQVQIKTRTRQHQWEPADLREIVLKRDESLLAADSQTVLDRLHSSLHEQFYFVTNGVLSPRLVGLLGKGIGSVERVSPDNSFEDLRNALLLHENDPSRHSLLDKKLTPEVLNRIYVYEGLQLADIEARVEHTLIQDYGIPISESRKRSNDLLDLVRDCAIRKNGKDHISIDDLVALIGTGGVTIPYSRIERIFQETDAYFAATLMLAKQHIVLLSGEPAIGKTAVAQKLTNYLVTAAYLAKQIGGDSAYLEVYRACGELDNVVFLMDDPFGVDEFEPSAGKALGNQLDEIALRLQEAKGRVKLILTSRKSVLTQAVANTKLKSNLFREYLVELPMPDVEFKKKVLGAHLNDKILESDKLDNIGSHVLSEQFEDLLHIQQFVNAVSKIASPSPHDITQKLKESRPSHYSQWIGSQRNSVKLFLYTLWVTSLVSPVIYEPESRRVYELLTTCLDLPAHDGMGSHFEDAKYSLLEQSRIQSFVNGRLDFIHPYLKSATQRTLENDPGFIDFAQRLIKTLSLSKYPLDQSIAASVITIYFDRFGVPLDDLQSIYDSPYLQVKDTVIKHGAHLLRHHDPKTQQFARQIYERYFRPGECELNENGHIVIIKQDVEGVYSSNALHEMFLWDIGVEKLKQNQELVNLFEKCVASHDYFSVLDPFQRYWFVDWLTSTDINLHPSDLADFLEGLATDPITFVRSRVASRLGNTFLSAHDLERVFEALCYDSSPFVKIKALEDGIIPNWAAQSEEKRQRLLSIVVDMLDDPIVRQHSANGLVNQSGSLYFYHEHHTPAQKQQWFEAVAPKLLQYDFEYGDHFERFLTAFDLYFGKLSHPYRARLLTTLSDYVVRNPFHSDSVAFSIQKIVLEEDSTQEEKDTLLNLINQLPPFAKADLSFRFARNYEKLPDERFQEFVHRPFFVESTDEFALERAAALLGFLDAVGVSVGILPEPVRVLADKTDEAIRRYIAAQTDDFKLILLFIAFGHQHAGQISAVSEGLSSHPLLKSLLRYFLEDAKASKHSIFAADLLIRAGYYCWKRERAGWYEYFELLLQNGDEQLGRAVCDIVFASNIASSVHDIKDMFFLMARLLAHPIVSVQQHAFMLFDNHFHEIWEELTSIHDEEYEREIHQTWFSEGFVSHLLKHSTVYREYVAFLMYLEKIGDTWDDLSKEQRISLVGELCQQADVSKFPINELLVEFRERMGDKLTQVERKKLEEVLFVGGVSVRNILGRTEQLEKDFKLRDLFPEIDWTKFTGAIHS